MKITQKFLKFYKRPLNCRPYVWGRTLHICDEDNFTIHLYENVLKNTYNFGLF